MTLYINNQPADINSSTSFYLTKERNDIAELKTKADVSREIILPKTHRNALILGYLDAPQAIVQQPYQKLSCALYEGNIPLVETPAYLSVLSNQSDGYHCCITSGNINLMEQLKNFSFQRDNDDTPADSTLGTFFATAPLNYYATQGDIYLYNGFYPAYRPGQLLCRVLEQLGYTVPSDHVLRTLPTAFSFVDFKKVGTLNEETTLQLQRTGTSNFTEWKESDIDMRCSFRFNIEQFIDIDDADMPRAFDSDNQLRLHIQPSFKFYFHTSNRTANLTLRIGTTQTSTRSYNIHFQNGNLVNTPDFMQNYADNVDGVHFVYITLRTPIDLTYSSGTDPQIYFDTVEQIIDLGVSYDARVYYTAHLQHAQKKAAWGEHMSIAENCGFKNAYDLLQAICQLHAFTLTPPITLEELGVRNLELGISKLQIQNSKFAPANFAQRNHITLQPCKAQDDYTLKATITCNNQTLTLEKDYLKLSLLSIRKLQDGYSDRRPSYLWTPDYNTGQGNGPVFKFTPLSNPIPFKLQNNTLALITAEDIIANYQPLQQLLTDYMEIEATIHLTPQEFEQFDLSRLHYIEYFSAYFYITALRDYNPNTQTATLTGLKVES